MPALQGRHVLSIPAVASTDFAVPRPTFAQKAVKAIVFSTHRSPRAGARLPFSPK